MTTNTGALVKLLSSSTETIKGPALIITSELINAAEQFELSQDR